MAHVGLDVDLRPSVFDRLLDSEPGVSTEPPPRRSVRLAELKDSVRRDLEWLLNTKRAPLPAAGETAHLRASLLHYGLPDFTHASLNRSEDRRTLQRVVEAAIRQFEPRLRDVEVTLVEGREHERGIRFRIDAALDVDPTPEAVTFDSTLDLTSKAFVLEPA